MEANVTPEEEHAPDCLNCGEPMIRRLSGGGGWWCVRCRRWYDPDVAQQIARNRMFNERTGA